MPYLTILLLSIAAGIGAHAFVTHLLIGVARRPRDHTHLLFALLALSLAVHTLVVLVMQKTASLASYILVYKYLFGPTALAAFVSFLWFVACYTGVWRRRFLVAMSLWITVLIALHVVLPFGILYTNISSLRQITLPWGEQIVNAQGTPSPVRLAFDLFNLAMFAFFFYALVRQYRGGNRRRALLLGLALIVFLAGRIVDVLIGLGVIYWMRTSELAFAGLVLTMSLVLSYEVTRTEHTLHAYQDHMHDLVAARTAELTRANIQLVQETRERRLLDAALQRRLEQLAALKQIADIAIRMTDLTAALQSMSEIAMALFDARTVLLLIPSTQAADLPLLVGFADGSGALGPMRLDVAATDMPFSTQVLTDGQSLRIPALQARSLPPAIRAFVTAYQLHSAMLIPLAIPGSVIGVMYVATDQPDRTFTADELSLAETIAADISAAISNNRLYQRSQAARERLTTLYQATQTISRASLEPEQVYVEIHRATARLMPVEALLIGLYDHPAQEVNYVYRADIAGPSVGWRAPLANSLAGYLLQRNAAVRIDDLSAFSPIMSPLERLGRDPEAGSGVAVLLRGSEQMLGMLFVQSDARDAYPDEDEETLKLLAAHAAIALENAGRYQHARDLAANEERTRLARELHDSVTQTLYSASLLAEALPVVWRRDLAAGAQSLTELRHLVRGALAEMRTLLFELRPFALLAADLPTLLHQLGHVLTSQTNTPVVVTIEGQAPIPADVKIALYRIAQEAFNNIAKHAGATQVAVRFHAAAHRLFLAVRDDGSGFDPAAIPDDHMGVRIMAERAAEIGARLQIDSAPWRGTEVSVSWPDPAPNDER